MSRALQVRHDGQPPVSHVWWTITRPLDRLGNAKSPYGPYSLAECEREWAGRELATASALKYARQAAGISDNEDIHWFARCLEVGQKYAEAVKLLARLKSGHDITVGARLEKVINDLEAHIRNNYVIKKTDVLGGDPGCWLETITRIKQLAESFAKKQ